jgi:hypothetical protein
MKMTKNLEQHIATIETSLQLQLAIHAICQEYLTQHPTSKGLIKLDSQDKQTAAIKLQKKVDSFELIDIANPMTDDWKVFRLIDEIIENTGCGSLNHCLNQAISHFFNNNKEFQYDYHHYVDVIHKIQASSL